MKNEIRILGIDDAPFDKFKDKETTIIGTFYRGGHYLDGILTDKVKVDGGDSTYIISNMVNHSKFKTQIQAIFLDGIAVGGFNIIDITELNKSTNIPVIVIMRNKPEIRKMIAALDKLGMQAKKELLRKAGEIFKTQKILFQCAGISSDLAKEFIRATTTHSDIPEPVRVAHIIGSGLVKGESRGKP